MKRFFAIAALFMLLITPAVSETIQLDAMTTDELLALRSEINTILSARMASDASVIYSGVYVTGKDIKAGRYVLRFDELAEGVSNGIVKVYESQENYKKFDYIIGDYLSLGNEYQIVLEDGMVLEIIRAKGTIRPIAKPDWAP